MVIVYMYSLLLFLDMGIHGISAYGHSNIGGLKI